ncbi:structural maintenance of chromosomes protein 2-like isoform X2 [Daktulosphaira vitifoliae]|uniref:structural maintenance of chromosomes protein 2-like isoform X2 n=1 Tax=Daktulosphaira vitifoliae TaxID=58002 RepID=UPI0021AADFB0|nr:structural maintenance of chromosomes protein 2-like isoform X2 [Daktulosphaira vitifoliae]
MATMNKTDAEYLDGKLEGSTIECFNSGVVTADDERSFSEQDKDISWQNLMKMSSSLKTNIDLNMKKVKYQMNSIQNEAAEQNNCEVLAEQSNVTVNELLPLSAFNNKMNDDNEINNFDVLNLEKCHLIQRNSEFNNSLKNIFVSQMGDPDQIDQTPKVKEKNRSENISFTEKEFFDNENDCIEEIGKSVGIIKKMFEVKNKCQNWIEKYDELHDKYLNLESKCIAIEQNNSSYQIELARTKSIEEENLRLNKLFVKETRVRNELETALRFCHEKIDKYQRDESTARDKVKEAIELVEKTCMEKQRVTEELKKSNDEVNRLEEELKRLVVDAGNKISIEIEKVKLIYDTKFQEVKIETQRLQMEKKTAERDLEKKTKEYADLTKKYESVAQECVSQPLVHLENVNSLIDQIDDYKIKCEKLMNEVEILKEANKQNQENYTRKSARYKMEIMFLKDREESLKKHLNSAMRQIAEDKNELLETTDRIKVLEMEINKSNKPKENSDQHDKKIIAELIKHIEAYKKTIDMWKNEMSDITKSLKNKIVKLKLNNRQLYQKNMKLKKMINISRYNYRFKMKKSLPFQEKMYKSKLTDVSSSA